MLGAALIPLLSLTSAVGQDSDNPIAWSLKTSLPRTFLKPEDKFTVVLTAKILEGWHLYSPEQLSGGPIPTRIALPVDQPFKLADAIDLPPVSRTEIDPNFNLETQFYEKEATFGLPVVINANAHGGKQEFKVNVSFQTCNSEMCLPPKVVRLTTEINIGGPLQNKAATTQSPLRPATTARPEAHPSSATGHRQLLITQAPSHPMAS